MTRTGASIRTKGIPDDAQWREHSEDKITRRRAHWRWHLDETTRRRAVARAFGRRGYPTTRARCAHGRLGSGGQDRLKPSLIFGRQQVFWEVIGNKFDF